MSNVRANGLPLPGEPGEDAGGPLVRIGELARRAGVPAATLRAWERRYGVVSPRRGESGYRLYSQEDERLLRAMVALIDGGLAPAEAAARVRAGGGEAREPAVGAAAPPFIAAARHDLLAALTSFDEVESDRQLDRAGASLSIDAFLAELVLPVLRELGERWARGETGVGEEHFATALIRGRLLGLARGWSGEEGGRAVLACPSGERHDLGVIIFGLMLRSRGWRATFLGADTPPDSIRACCERIEPGLVVLFSRDRAHFDAARGSLEEIASSRPLMLAGEGAEPDLCARVGAARFEGGPVESAMAIVA